MNDQWQDNLRNRMELHEEPAPEGLWEEIDRNIAGVPAAGEVSTSRKHRLRGIYIGAVSAVAAIAILLLLILRYTSSENQTDASFTEKTVPVAPHKEQPMVEIPTAETQVAASQNEVPTTKEAIKEGTATLFVDGDINRVLSPESDTVARKPVPETREHVLTPDPDQPASDRSAGNEPLLAMNTRQDRQTHSKWETSLSMSNSPSGSSSTYSGYGTLAVAETVNEQYDFVPNYTREQAYTDVKHHQPVTFGITLRYNLNERWSVASGLTYTQLTSELRSGSGNYYYDDRQTLHYLGVPLNIAYTFWQNNKISTYVSTGGLVEKNITGRLTSNYYIDNQLKISTKEKITTKELQWSANAAMGLGYQISNNIGLYAEPGISYYFKNGSELETIYKDNPLHFNLRLGLRVTLGD